MSQSSKVTVCRGCCCGTTRKHPEFDHDEQLTRFRSDLGVANVHVADCLDVCEESNVLVVRPAPAARARGARPAWFGGVLTDEATHAVVAWVAAGGPGRAELPAGLARHVIERDDVT